MTLALKQRPVMMARLFKIMSEKDENKELKVSDILPELKGEG